MPLIHSANGKVVGIRDGKKKTRAKKKKKAYRLRIEIC